MSFRKSVVEGVYEGVRVVRVDWTEEVIDFEYDVKLYAHPPLEKY